MFVTSQDCVDDCYPEPGHSYYKWHYDANGHLQKTQEGEVGENGMIVKEETCYGGIWDEQCRPLEAWQEGDGKSECGDKQDCQTFMYDENGFLIEYGYSSKCDGKYDNRYSRECSVGENSVIFKEDNDSNGIADVCRYYEYASCFKTLKQVQVA